ncbi:unnamed protein product, partial [Symbiodinium sp. KB8]
MKSLKEAAMELFALGLHLVIGGKSLGKTKIVKTMVDQAGDAALLYVDMRLPPVYSSDALAEAKRRWSTKNVPPWLPDVAALLGALSAAVARVDFKKDEVVQGGLAQAVSFLLNIKSPEDFVKAFGAAAVAGGQVPVIMIDEANLAFPTNGENGGENAAKREGLGFNKYDSLKSIVCPEVEEEPMLEVLKEWGLSQDLAK